MKRICVLLLFIICLQSSLALKAHEIRPAFLQIVQVEQNSYEVYWKVPSMGDAVPNIQPVFPVEFKMETLKLSKPIQNSVIYYYLITSDQSLEGKEIYIQGLNKTLIDVLVTVEYLNGEKATLLLQPDFDTRMIPGKTTAVSIIKTYTVLGIEHILLGIDHLLFVLALILITKGKWKILKTITAFTIAHSITLSLAALGYANFPGPPVEAVIALSIVFLALEILKNLQGEATLTSNKPWIVAFTFGLLHGFGFAGALTDIGLPQQDIPLALAFFNVGVEIGQIMFVVVAILLLELLNLKKNWPVFLKKIPAYAIGSVAAFWMIQRIVGFWD
jgi:hydrogenase/urease accessory protein HupE